MTKEDEILKAAEEEFFNNGYDATSTATIAKRAGVTHAMVNYYFRTKEKLFVQILDNHVYDLLMALKPIMQVDGDVARVAAEAALIIFDKMNENRRFANLISDISKTHPDFLLRYSDTFASVCLDSLEMHSKRLEKGIADGVVRQCTMHDIYSTVIILATAPFMHLSILENLAGLSPERIDSYLQERRAEMVRIIRLRYSTEQN